MYNYSSVKLQWLLLIFLGISGCDSTTDAAPIVPVPPGAFDWYIQASGAAENLTDINFTSASTGWALGNQMILATSNGGASWPVAPIDPGAAIPEQLNSVFFINNQFKWMTGTVIRSRYQFKPNY